MAGSKTQYLAQKVIGRSLGLISWTPPSTLYVVLSTAAFSGTATGSSCNEVTAGDYARVSVTNNTSNWSTPTNALPSVVSNANDIVFATASSDWGTPLAVYLADASSGGNLLYGADIFGGDDIASGTQFKILAGTFIFSED